MKKANKTNVNNNQPFENNNINNKGRISKSDCDPNEQINDNISEKANSVQTSYHYRKDKKGPNSTSSKGFHENNNKIQNIQNDYETSIEMSENDNLICPNCINCTLMEQRRERDRENLNNYRDRDYEFENTNALIDKNRDFDRDLIDEKRRQRERNQNDAYQNLAKIKAGMSNKDKLIQINENSRNPLNEGFPDYQYQKFQDEYAKRQKMIQDNINKYYPNINNERPEISSYYDNYVNNPNYESTRKRDTSLEKDRQRKYDDYDNKERNRREYVKALEDQINYKNELKRREKEEERRRVQRQYEEIQRELKREEEERYLKEQRKKEEYKIANLELMNQKKDRKIKELQEQLKYREILDKQNEDYKREKEREQYEKDKLRDDIYNQNKEYNRQKMKELEKEKEKERQYDNDMYKNDYQGFDPRKKCGKYDKYDKFNIGYKDKKFNEFGENDIPDYDKRKYQERYGDKGFDSKYNEKYGPKYDKYGKKIYNDNENQNKNRDRYGDEGKYESRYDKNGQMKVKERMGRCCRCHRIFPRRLLSINRYFYKENRI